MYTQYNQNGFPLPFMLEFRIRINVDDVEGVANTLVTKGVDVVVKSFEWGQVGTFHDPDGNKCELKNADDPFFK